MCLPKIPEHMLIDAGCFPGSSRTAEDEYLLGIKKLIQVPYIFWLIHRLRIRHPLYLVVLIGIWLPVEGVQSSGHVYQYL
jgi:hypothetical protein